MPILNNIATGCQSRSIEKRSEVDGLMLAVGIAPQTTPKKTP